MDRPAPPCTENRFQSLAGHIDETPEHGAASDDADGGAGPRYHHSRCAFAGGGMGAVECGSTPSSGGAEGVDGLTRDVGELLDRDLDRLDLFAVIMVRLRRNGTGPYGARTPPRRRVMRTERQARLIPQPVRNAPLSRRSERATPRSAPTIFPRTERRRSRTRDRTDLGHLTTGEAVVGVGYSTLMVPDDGGWHVQQFVGYPTRTPPWRVPGRMRSMRRQAAGAIVESGRQRRREPTIQRVELRQSGPLAGWWTRGLVSDLRVVLAERRLSARGRGSAD